MFYNFVFSHEVCRPIVVAASSKRLSSACHIPFHFIQTIRAYYSRPTLPDDKKTMIVRFKNLFLIRKKGLS